MSAFGALASESFLGSFYLLFMVAIQMYDIVNECRGCICS